MMIINKFELSHNAEEATAFLKQVANKNRLMILCILFEGEKSVSELNKDVAISQSALSQHLAKLRESGMVKTRKETTTIFYSLADPKVEKLIETLQTIFNRQ